MLKLGKPELKELVLAGIIDQDTASKIESHFSHGKNIKGNRLIMVFGILGAILVGLGLILILAHNWDQLPKSIKLIIAFIPLVISQLLCAYALFVKKESTALRETAATLLFFAIGSSIALVSQIYNIPGSLGAFLFGWMLLVLPTIYLLRSNMVFVFYIIGITYYGIEVGYTVRPLTMAPYYWILLLCALPYYIFQCKYSPNRNFTHLLHWAVALSVLICFNTSIDDFNNTSNTFHMVPAFMSLLACFYFIGHLTYFSNKRVRNNPYLLFGSVGSLIILLLFTFEFMWEELYKMESISFFNTQVAILAFCTLIALSLLIKAKIVDRTPFKPLDFAFILFIILWYLISYPIGNAIILNIAILIFSILTIREGAERNHLGILNYGLIIIAILTTCRFFDTNLSFVGRGILFVLVGVGFFFTNYWIINKRKESNE